MLFWYELVRKFGPKVSQVCIDGLLYLRECFFIHWPTVGNEAVHFAVELVQARVAYCYGLCEEEDVLVISQLPCFVNNRVS